MRYVKNALFMALVVLTMSLAVLAQTPRLTTDPRNQAPTVGSGGSVGGATGLFTVVDGTTLRAGEYTFSAAYSNFDRDPGNVDITEVPVSFQIGLNDYIELFFNTDAYRQIKVNSPRNLSGFYLPNASINGVSQSALVLTPAAFGAGNIANSAVFRPAGQQGFVQFPFVGGAGGGIFGPIGPFRTSSGNGADLFPGVGSAVGGILPGLVLSTTGTGAGTVINSSTIAPSYLPDAPFLSRQYAESAFNSFTVGAKFRFTSPKNLVGVGLLPFYRFYSDRPNDISGFNQLQRGASPGSKRGDFGLIAFGDARLTKWANVSGNVGYVYTGSVKANFGSDDLTILDRGDELIGAVAVDFPVNKYFQPIAEFRATKYVGGRTPNAFEQDPIDALAGVRIFPTRYFGMSFAYRYNVNQQDADSFESGDSNARVGVGANGVPTGFVTSDDPHGYIAQVFIGRRNSRVEPTKPNSIPVINSVTLSDTEVVLPICPEGQRQAAGASCNDSTNVTVATVATDADQNDQLLYQYTVSGGRVTGTGANVTWDLTGAQPGTYTISVGVDDGCGVCGQPQTKEVRVVACNSCEPIPVENPCPTDLRVTASPSETDPNTTVTFTADATLNSTSPSYNWQVSSGTIESGQGTPTITVRVPQSGSVTATVELGGVGPNCSGLTSSATATVRPSRDAELVDEYGVLKPDPEKGRLDNAAARINADPNGRLFVITYSSTRGGQREAQRRANFAVKYLTDPQPRGRAIDASRIVTINGGVSSNGEARTQIYFVPAGATEPVAQP